MSDELKAYGLTFVENDDESRERIDFIIKEGDDGVATVWGSRPDDVDFECSHPYQCIEFGDDREEQGECLLCGSWCDWHGVPDEDGHAYPEPHEWYPRRKVGGLIGEYLKELKGKEQYGHSTYRNYNSYAVWF